MSPLTNWQSNSIFIKANYNNKKTKTQDYLKMEFDPANNAIKLCAEGMQMEGKGKPEEASKLFF